eukprot:CAMPEP_0205855376 /NCGR_PEP_ID=MMETSP1083-20121108/2572_1 /ASSEMBLY_ACC=CAM_ASM_000430 /TAXON_ID=97485 /ORGANISM="Prymnesium parvum, Strain Texoma1" /LENGTH=235 /DNA_ID=CAMNT_0053216747 /DNA_START=23 /DNA_END=730 /DNA_ORIENTATION=-
MAERDPPGPGSGEHGQIPPLIQWDDELPTDPTPASGFSHSPSDIAASPPAHNTTLGATEQVPSQPDLAVPLSYPEPPPTGACQSASAAVPSSQSSLVTRAAELTGEPAATPMQPLVTTQRHPPTSVDDEGAGASVDKTSVPACREPAGTTPGLPRTSAANTSAVRLSMTAPDNLPRHFGDAARAASGTPAFQTPSTVVVPTTTALTRTHYLGVDRVSFLVFSSRSPVMSYCCTSS